VIAGTRCAALAIHDRQFLLVDRKVAECFARFQEHNRVTFALVAWTGFRRRSSNTNDSAAAWQSAGHTGEWSRRCPTRSSASRKRDSRHDDHRRAGIAPDAADGGLYHLPPSRGHPILGWTSIMLPLTLFFGLQF
jgi:dolichol-phosphate mannosyltransferase